MKYNNVFYQSALQLLVTSLKSTVLTYPDGLDGLGSSISLEPMEHHGQILTGEQDVHVSRQWLLRLPSENEETV